MLINGLTKPLALACGTRRVPDHDRRHAELQNDHFPAFCTQFRPVGLVLGMAVEASLKAILPHSGACRRHLLRRTHALPAVVMRHGGATSRSVHMRPTCTRAVRRPSPTRGQVIVPIACFDAGSATCAPVQLRVVARARLLRVRRDPGVQDRTTDNLAKQECARAKSRRGTLHRPLSSHSTDTVCVPPPPLRSTASDARPVA